MSNTEHLIENILCAIEDNASHDEIFSDKRIAECATDITVNQGYEIANYIYYTYRQSVYDKMIAQIREINPSKYGNMSNYEALVTAEEVIDDIIQMIDDE